MVVLEIKPLSVNEVWRGRRFKTDKYKNYEKIVLLMLPRINIPEPPYKVYYEFGFSSNASDIDNPVKPFTDILQKKYDINDKNIFEMIIKKYKVEKGNEYIKFKIDKL